MYPPLSALPLTSLYVADCNRNCSGLQSVHFQGIRLRRDSGVSVMYAEGLNSTKSSGSL